MALEGHLGNQALETLYLVNFETPFYQIIQLYSQTTLGLSVNISLRSIMLIVYASLNRLREVAAIRS